jgi:cytochrome c oxidase subunit 2
VTHRSIRRLTLAAGALGAALALGGCARHAPQDTWKPAGNNARHIQNLQWPVFLIAGIVGVLVFATVGFVVVRFKDRGQDIPEQSHGKPALEITLTIIPALILLAIGIPTVKTVFTLAKSSDAQCVVNVTGQQWWWEYDYPAQDGCVPGGIEQPIVTSGQLVIPTKTNVLLQITSRDVIHSFWIPRLNGKRDAVPGRVQPLRMEADRPGIFSGQCTEFCGLSHARMRMEAVALDAADFATWVTNQNSPAKRLTKDDANVSALALTGQDTFEQQCTRCHQVDGFTSADGTPVLANPDLYEVSGAAPNLTHLMTRNTFAGATWDLLSEACKDKVWNAKPEDFGKLYLQGVTPDCLNAVDLREWLRNAPAKKPMYADPAKLNTTGGKYRGMPNLNLTDDQIDGLVAYLLERK